MIKFKNFFGRIFSIKDVGLRKQYNILGIKFNIRSNSTKFKKEYSNLPIQNNKIIFIRTYKGEVWPSPYFLSELKSKLYMG